MKRKRYMTKRRIEEKISRQRKATLFMLFAVMLTTVTLTYKNVNGDFSRLTGNIFEQESLEKLNCSKKGGKWDSKKGCVMPDNAKKNATPKNNKKFNGNDYMAADQCKKAGGTWNNGCTLPDKNSGGSNQTPNGNSGGSNQTPNNNGGNYNSNNDSLDEKSESANGTIVSPKLTINSSDVVLYVNKTYQLKVTSNIKNDKITYSSNDKNIVIVGSKGLIKGKKEGQAKITATSSSGATIDVNITVGKKFDIGVNYGPNSKVSINKSNKVILNVTDTRLINVWLFDDKLNGNTIYERDYNKVKKSGAIEVKNLPEKGKTKKFYVKNRDSAKLYSYTTFVIKNNNGKYNRSTGPTIKNVRGLQIGDEKYIAYTVSSSHGLSAIKDGKANGKFDNTYSDLNGVNEQSNIVKLSDMNKSKNNYYYLWIHAADNSSFKNYTRTSVQIKLK